MLFQIKTGYVCYIMQGHVCSYLLWLGQFMSCYVRLRQVRSG